MNFITIRQANGDPTISDDMSPRLRAFACLLEHANRREAAGLTPSACPCAECEWHRATFARLGGLTGGLTTEEYQAECAAFAATLVDDCPCPRCVTRREAAP